MTPQEKLKVLLSRKSQGKLKDPAPNQQEIESILQVANQAPDHANLKPWRFKIYQAEERKKLGQLFLQAAQKKAPLDETSRKKFLSMPLRAPLVIIAYCHYKKHPKVPKLEQQLATGAAVTNILHACHQLNFGAIWRTGSLAFDKNLHQSIGLKSNESVIAFIYIGTPV